ncbi:unnamed protein product [Tuber melanosporum]|uniref:(Perigord truffle) hypothetical protein n=1 Tax=Tuber melanosporum (strain Mel28) TaxID=656061 RepID=D5GIU2_TUBMM|nr:uncharacterized protein GSTUM_00008675001 [Tuber melanosporum]CAZ84435.1 unnamed protein product [Tuber melanosporum]
MGDLVERRARKQSCHWLENRRKCSSPPLISTLYHTTTATTTHLQKRERPLHLLTDGQANGYPPPPPFLLGPSASSPDRVPFAWEF